MDRRVVLLTGATGFVGRAVRPQLVAAGWKVRCLSRDVSKAAAQLPGLDWVAGNIDDPRSCVRALEGCEAAIYLVHGIGQATDFAQREVAGARGFADAAAAAGVRHIVYLGGIAPNQGEASPHLRSRLDVGEALRAGAVPTVELRASMIVGHGSLSWLIVRDLAARLRFMVLPRWLRSRTQPVAIADVVDALLAALDLAPDQGASFDLPGPDVLSGRQLLETTAEVMRLPRPIAVELRVLTPRLSSQWVRFVTRADWSVAREVVVGLSHDLLARDDRFWGLVGHPQRLSFRDAALQALATEDLYQPVGGVWGAVERMLRARDRPVHG